MGRDLTNLYVSESFQYLIQQSGSEFQNGLGTKVTGTIDITSQYANVALAANTAAVAISSSYATTASYALNAGAAVDTGSLMKTGSVNSNILTFTKGDGSTFNLTVDTGSAVTTDTGSLLVTASISNATTTFTKGDGSTFSLTTNNVVNADSASIATSASYALQATSASFSNTSISSSYSSASLSSSFSTNSISASYSDFALTASYALNSVTVSTGSLLTTASVSSNTITFTKGDGSTFPITVDTGSGGGGNPFPFSGSATITGSLNVTGSVTGNVLGNNTDIYTSSAPVQQVVTLTQAEYNAIGSPDANTLYIISGSIPNQIASSVIIPDVVLASGSWSYTSSYYQYTYPNINITTSSSIDFTPYNTSSFTVLEARVQPYIQASASACILYSLYLPTNNILGQFTIINVS